MKPELRFVDVLFIVVIAVCAGAMGGAYVNHDERERAAAVAGVRMEAKALFTAKDEITVEFPSVVHGQQVKCFVVANTQRKVFSLSC